MPSIPPGAETRATGAPGTGAAGAWQYRPQLRHPRARRPSRPVEVAATSHSELCGDRVPGPLGTSTSLEAWQSRCSEGIC